MCQDTDESFVYSDMSDNGSLEMVGPLVYCDNSDNSYIYGHYSGCLLCQDTDESFVYSDISDNGSLEMVGIPRVFRQFRQFQPFSTLLGVSAPCPWVLCARTMTNPPCIPTFPTMGRWKWSESLVYSDNSDNSDISGHYSGCLSRAHGAAKSYK